MGIEAAHDDSFKIEHESKLYLGAENVACTVSFSLLFKFSPSKLNNIINLDDRLQSNQESIVASHIDEHRNGLSPAFSCVSSGLSKSGLMVADHHMTVSRY